MLTGAVLLAAGALGMSAKTLDKVYGHHVDFQKKAEGFCASAQGLG